MGAVKRRARRWAVVGTGAIAALLGSAPAYAHPEVAPTLTNRYFTVAALGDKLEVTLSLLYGNLPAAEARRDADSDHDGRLSAAETATMRDSFRRRAGGLMQISIDGKTDLLPIPGAPPLEVLIDLGGTDTVAAAPLVVEIIARGTAASARHTIAVGAAFAPERLGETELGAVLGPDWRLVESRLGTGPPLRNLVFKLAAGADRGETVQATFVIEPVAVAAQAPSENSAGGKAPRRLVVGLGAAVAIAIIIGVRLRRSRKP